MWLYNHGPRLLLSFMGGVALINARGEIKKAKILLIVIFNKIIKINITIRVDNGAILWYTIIVAGVCIQAFGSSGFPEADLDIRNRYGEA